MAITPKIKKNFFLDPVQSNWLKIRAILGNRSEAAILREIIDQVRSRESNPIDGPQAH